MFKNILKNWKAILGWNSAKTGYEVIENLLTTASWIIMYPLLHYCSDKTNPRRRQNLWNDFVCTSVGLGTYFGVRYTAETVGLKVLKASNKPLNFLISIAVGVLARQYFQGVTFNRWVRKRNQKYDQAYSLFPQELPGLSVAKAKMGRALNITSSATHDLQFKNLLQFKSSEQPAKLQQASNIPLPVLPTSFNKPAVFTSLFG